jgi:hypothetical protein
VICLLLLVLQVNIFDERCPLQSHCISLIAYFSAGVLCVFIAMHIKNMDEYEANAGWFLRLA